MATKKSKYLPPDTIKEDRKALLALRVLSNYMPPNADLSIEAACALEQRLRDTEEKEILSTLELTADRNSRRGAGWDLHNTIQRIKTVVRGQYGPNSQELQSLGLKRQDDYQRPGIHITPPETQAS